MANVTYIWPEGDDWLRGTELSRRAAIDIPDGYRRVWSGAIKPGDLCLNRQLFWVDGLVEWMQIEPTGDPIIPGNKTYRPIYNCAQLYSLVIRQGTEFNGGCDRCQARKRDGGMKYCDICANLIKEEFRGSH